MVQNHVEENGTESNGSETPEAIEAPAKFVVPLAKQGEINVTPYMKSSLDRVAVAEGFVDYDISIVHGSGIGDGFIGLVFKATIQEKGNSDKKLTVVVKTPPDNLVTRNNFGSMEFFDREVRIYATVLPAFVKFQEEKHIKPGMGFFEVPKCYLAEYDLEKDDAIIIMEDLRESGHKMWNKNVPMDFEHSKLIFAALGRLHAVSFAMKVQKPEIFEPFKNLNDTMVSKVTDPNMKAMFEGMIERAAETLDENDTRRRNKVLKLKEELAPILVELVNPENAEPFAVLGHGDCWSNNFMFHYKAGRPRDVVLLDWQITRYVSPILDLVYFLFASTDAGLRAKHFDELLNIYHRSLKDLLDHLGGDTMTQFPFTALLRQLKKFGKFGIIMAAMIVPLITKPNEELADMDFMAGNMDTEDEEIKEAMMKSFLGKPDDRFKGRMQGVLHDAIRYGFL